MANPLLSSLPESPLSIAQMVAAGELPVARYYEAGPVYRLPPRGSDDPVEHLQIGFEWFGNGGSPAEDAEALFGLTDLPEIGRRFLGLGARAVRGRDQPGARRASSERSMTMEQQTFGQKAVGLSFNPSNDDAVANCKAEFAAVIDRMNDLRNDCVG